MTIHPSLDFLINDYLPDIQFHLEQLSESDRLVFFDRLLDGYCRYCGKKTDKHMFDCQDEE